jgi:hypothetical protein
VQCAGLVAGEIDAFLIETCQDPLQIKAAVNGAKRARTAAGKDIPIIVQVTIEMTGTLLVGADIAAAADAAKTHMQAGKFAIVLQNTTQQPAQVNLKERSVRERVFKASTERAEHSDANDTRAIIQRLAVLRAQRAKLLGFPDYASYAMGDQMAKTPANALKLLTDTVPAATAKARGEAAKMQKVIDLLEDTYNININHINCGNDAYGHYLDLMNTRRNINDTMTLAGGHKALLYNGIPLTRNKFMPADGIDFYDTGLFTIDQISDWDWIEGESKQILHQVAGTPTYSATITKYCDMVCALPGGLARLTGITA